MSRFKTRFVSSNFNFSTLFINFGLSSVVSCLGVFLSGLLSGTLLGDSFQSWTDLTLVNMTLVVLVVLVFNYSIGNSVILVVSFVLILALRKIYIGSIYKMLLLGMLVDHSWVFYLRRRNILLLLLYILSLRNILLLWLLLNSLYITSILKLTLFWLIYLISKSKEISLIPLNLNLTLSQFPKRPFLLLLLLLIKPILINPLLLYIVFPGNTISINKTLNIPGQLFILTIHSHRLNQFLFFCLIKFSISLINFL